MRVFTTLCKDEKTGYQMVLSECSYNMAMDWLERKVKKELIDPGFHHYISSHNGIKLIKIVVDSWHEGVQKYVENRIFYYDEDRGYLMGE